jgi:hypothetical protein
MLRCKNSKPDPTAAAFVAGPTEHSPKTVHICAL